MSHKGKFVLAGMLLGALILSLAVFQHFASAIDMKTLKKVNPCAAKVINPCAAKALCCQDLKSVCGKDPQPLRGKGLESLLS